MATAANERLDLRVPSQIKRMIEHAAALSGQTVSSFILGTVTRKARRVIRDAEVIELTNRDRDRFLAALEKTGAQPNAALRRAAERYKAAMG
jgi:uncharacterized protein (DUF1778 family)